MRAIRARLIVLNRLGVWDLAQTTNWAPSRPLEPSGSGWHARSPSSAREPRDIFESVSTNPPDDEHDAEGSTVGFEATHRERAARSRAARLSELDAALEQPDAGGLRACEECGLAIPPERLAALPETRRCAACSAQSGQRGPLRPPRR